MIFLIGIVIIIALQVVILLNIKVSKEVKEVMEDFDDSPYTKPGSPFYTNKVTSGNGEGDE